MRLRVGGDEGNLLRPERFGRPLRVRAMTRYRAPLGVATATADIARDELHLQFERPERAVAPVQLVALYDIQTDEVLGSARISAADGRWCNVEGNSR